MEKKYCLTDITKVVNGRTLHQIKALKDFSDVKAGDLGGFIEKEENLSQKGNAWVYDNALVYGNAWVYGEAQIYDNARIYEEARICGYAQVYDNAQVYGRAWVYDNARIGSNAKIYGKTSVHGNAKIWGNVQVYGNALVRDNTKIWGDVQVHDNAKILGNVQVCDNVQIYGNAFISGDSIIFENAKIFNHARILGNSYIYGNVQIGQKIAIKDADCNFLTLEENIRCQTGLIPLNGKVIAYKQVRKDLTSFYNNNFQYKIGEWAEAESFEISDESCAAGLHFSNANYWNQAENLEDSSFLIAEIKLEDIITVQEGKIRCKKAFILGKYDAPAQDD